MIIIINYNFTSSPYSPGVFTTDPLKVAIQSDSISPMHVLKCHWMEKLRYLTVSRNGLVITDSTYLLRAGRSGVRTPVEARFSVPVHIGPEAHPASCTMGSESLSRAGEKQRRRGDDHATQHTRTPLQDRHGLIIGKLLSTLTANKMWKRNVRYLHTFR
jgi:hypothetical protein